MTADEFGTVDVDLLADFIGDALDGPERQRVARLVADDPEWRSAYARLAPAMDSVGAELGAMGAAAEPMPDDLWVRLEDSFTSPIAEPTMIDPELAKPTEPHLEPVRGASDRHLVSVPTGDSVTAPSSVPTGASATTPSSVPVGVDGRKQASRRRRLRWAAPIAAAAGVVAFAGFGAAYLSGDKSGQDASNSSEGVANAPMAAADKAERAGGGSLVTGPAEILSSGTRYASKVAPFASTTDPLMQAPSSAPTPAGGNSPSAGDTSINSSKRESLSRLRPTDALRACLEAVALENGGVPIVVQSVDYASFGGESALIIRFTADQVASIWATGPDCGAPGLGAQVRSRVRVG